MKPGPNLILKPSGSEKLVKIATFSSGNTCRGRFWSDGKSEFPGLHRQSWLLVHPSDKSLFWNDECQKVAKEELSGEFGIHHKVPFAIEPRLDDYRRAIDPSVSDTREKRIYVLTRFWHSANDPFRQKRKQAEHPDDFAETLAELRSLLDIGEAMQRITAAEIARELGDFGTAVKLLECPFPPQLSYYRRKIREWSEAAITIVREMKDD